MPCLTPYTDSAEEVKAEATAEKAKLQERIAKLEAMLCGTRKALVNANHSLARPIFSGIDYEEMGISARDYITDYAMHEEKDLKREAAKKTFGS